MPTDEQITIETEDRLMVINACFGSRVNDTLGKILAALLISKQGESLSRNLPCFETWWSRYGFRYGALQTITNEVSDEVVTYTGCIGGAILDEEYLQHMRDAGFADAKIASKAGESIHGAYSAYITGTKPE